MKKIVRKIIIILGAAMILLSLLLSLYNLYKENLIKKDNIETLKIIEKEIKDKKNNSFEDNKTIKIGEYEYIGYLEIPKLALKLPVMDDWDYTRLNIAPCRQQGTLNDDNLVIAAHNSLNHFGKLKELAIDDKIIFIDVSGKENNYVVKEIASLDPYEVATVLNSNYELVLYTCNDNAKKRITIYCQKIND